MYPDDLVFGLLNTSSRIHDAVLCAKLRSFTISWSRYGYRGPFIEQESVNLILDQAVELGYRWCLIQAYGHIIAERWSPRQNDSKPLERVLVEYLGKHAFFVTGNLLGDAVTGYGVADEFMLIDLKAYVALGKPTYESRPTAPVEGLEPTAESVSPPPNAVPAVLLPSGETMRSSSQTRGWNFVDTSLRHGLSVYAFESDILRNSINLTAASPAQLAQLSLYLDDGILNYSRTQHGSELSDSQKEFLDSVQRSIKNSKQGVFLWNLEPYDDVRIPPSNLTSAVSTLYCVAAGFKPNMILESLGFDAETNVVFFDYSSDALKVKHLLCDEWDGEDFPAFVRYLFKKLPYPSTWYYLWSGFNPDTIPEHELNSFWEMELAKWGGADKFKNHWLRFKQLRHEYVVCNILTQAEQLHERIRRESSAVIWWSNAFFTVYSNWFMTVEERHRIYDNWIKGLASVNPELFLYGSDYANNSVNHIQAGSYYDQFFKTTRDDLNPIKLSKVEIRF